MGNEIKVGEGMLDYVLKLYDIQEHILTAYETASDCARIIGYYETYRGDAKSEMQDYFNSLQGHLGRMLTLYQAASTYVLNAYMEYYYNEDEIMDKIIGQLGAGYGSGD